MPKEGERLSADSTHGNNNSTPTVRPAGRALEIDASFRLSNAPFSHSSPAEQRMNRVLGP
jgi:hypothetical protein